MPLPDDTRFTRDPKLLVRELDATMKLHDMEKIRRYREQVELKWYEAGIVLLLFISGLGFVITIFKLIPQQNSALFWFVFFWFLLFTITLVAAVEFLLAKIHALRELYHHNTLILERIEKQLSHFGQQQEEQPPQPEAEDQ